MRLSVYARWLALAGLAGTIIGLLAWQGWWAAPRHPWIGLLLSLPLLLPLRGLWRGQAYTYAWTSLLVLAYLGYLLMEFVAVGGAGILAAPALVSAMALFTGSVCYVRWRARETV